MKSDPDSELAKITNKLQEALITTVLNDAIFLYLNSPWEL